MTWMKKKFGGFNLIIMLLLLVFAGAVVLSAFQQPAPGTTVYWRPTNQFGYNSGTTVGIAFPTAANAGDPPINGEGPAVLLTAAGDQTPAIGYYSQNDTQWITQITSTLATNAPNVANSVWGASAGVMFEGATANAHEFFLTTADMTADVIYSVLDDAADTYNPVATPDGNLTTATWAPFGIDSGADTDWTGGANERLSCNRVYLPYPITVATAAALLVDGAALAAADIVGVAIYDDAAAGARLAYGTGDGTAAHLEVITLTAGATLMPGWHRHCVCTSDATNLLVAGVTLDDEAIDVLSGVSAEIIHGYGANPCVTGVPPATTGALTTEDVANPIVIWY